MIPVTILIPLILSLSVNVFAQLGPNDSEETKVNEPENAKNVLTGNTEENKLYILRKYNFINNALINISDTSDSIMAFDLSSEQQLPLFLDSEGLKGLAPQSLDPIGDELRRRNSDIPPTIPLNDAIKNLVESFKKSPKKLENRDLPIPTDMEIDILKVLWVEGSATPSEIYANLDTSALIFAEELQTVLESMVSRGFLDRKKISPSHEFNLFGLAQIELSSKNRKNKVYIYWPIVTRERLFTYLDAKRYLALVAARNDNDYDFKNNDYKNNYLKYLEKKLYRMFE